MPSTALVWFRRDLRVHDHPSLVAADEECERVLCAFVLDPRLIRGRFPSAARTGFLLATLCELREALRERGADLVVREGRHEDVLPALAREAGAEAAYFAGDVSPYARGRDARTVEALAAAGVEVRRRPGTFVADVTAPTTANGRPFTVFSPFWRRWAKLERRPVLAPPAGLAGVPGVEPGEIPDLAHFGLEPELPHPVPPGERAGRARADAFLAEDLDAYPERHDRLAGGTSGLSPYIHFGCVSVRELEQRARDAGSPGADAFVRQLAWRDFYAHVLWHFPGNARHAFKPEFDGLQWSDDEEALAAWTDGRTGYPVVDAGMRQLRTTGWMHNRARLITASFLTKDLHLDWRRGEAVFMRYLICGDEAQNNGNWQWITSIGVDPQPFYRRMYNPMAQQRRHDPDGEYVRRWVPELRDVPLAKLAEPWTMTAEEQRAAGCVIGRDYPAPIVDHKRERARAMERYRAVTSS
jgi:deoxyribodipyrimidine photo-lyase